MMSVLLLVLVFPSWAFWNGVEHFRAGVIEITGVHWMILKGLQFGSEFVLFLRVLGHNKIKLLAKFWKIEYLTSLKHQNIFIWMAFVVYLSVVFIDGW